MLRKSERSNVVCSLIVPVRKPFPRGLNGTKPLPSSSRVGDTKEELPVNDSLHCNFAVYSLTLFKQTGITESDGALTLGLSAVGFRHEDPCSYQPENEDSSGDHKGEMHAREERLLIPHKRSQDRDPYDTTHLPAHIQHA